MWLFKLRANEYSTRLKASSQHLLFVKVGVNILQGWANAIPAAIVLFNQGPEAHIEVQNEAHI